MIAEHTLVCNKVQTDDANSCLICFNHNLEFPQNTYHVAGKIGGTKFWRMTKKVVLANIILAIQYMQLTTPIASPLSNFCLGAMVQDYHVYCDIWQASRNEILH